MNPLYVGIDVSIKSNVAYLMKPDGSKHSSFSVPNTRDGSRQLVKRILSAITSESLTDVVIGLEAISVYGDNLICFLREDGSSPYNKKIHVLNLKQINKFKLSGDEFPFMGGMLVGMMVRPSGAIAQGVPGAVITAFPAVNILPVGLIFDSCFGDPILFSVTNQG